MEATEFYKFVKGLTKKDEEDICFGNDYETITDAVGQMFLINLFLQGKINKKITAAFKEETFDLCMECLERELPSMEKDQKEWDEWVKYQEELKAKRSADNG